MKVNINISGEVKRKTVIKYLLIIALLYKLVPVNNLLFLFEEPKQETYVQVDHRL